MAIIVVPRIHRVLLKLLYVIVNISPKLPYESFTV